MRLSAALGVIALVALSPAATAGEPEYAQVLAAIAGERAALAERWRGARSAKARAEVLREAREVARAAIVEGVIPPWYGTPWDFHGTSQQPGEGTIACGYFVSTILRDAGFNVERIRLAQQASENIVKTLSPPERIRRFRASTPEAVIEALRAGEDGLYVVGLDFHVGFVVKDAERVTFCHSSWIGAGGVVCEDPATTDAWVSNYYVIGRLLDDAMLISWLEGIPIATKRG